MLEWYHLPLPGASLIAQLIKNLPAIQEAWVRSLGWDDPLEKGTGYPLQYSGLENSMVCIVHGVAKSQTQMSDFHITSPPKLINTYVELDRERWTMKVIPELNPAL